MNYKKYSQISQQLPPLVLSEGDNSAFLLSPLVQSYLNHYDINFSSSINRVEHCLGYIETHGYKLACHYWIPELSEKTLFIVHGYLDHSGLYSNAIRYALQNDFSVVVFDLPGHGLSSGKRAEISSFDEYSSILESVANKVQDIMPRPFHILGQSTGGAVVLNYLWNHSFNRFNKVILLAPMVRSGRWTMTNILLFLLGGFVKRWPRRFPKNSHNEDFLYFIKKKDIFQPRLIPLAWFKALKIWVKQFVVQSPSDKKVLIIQGDDDCIVDWEFNRKIIERLLPHSTFIMVPGGRHHLVNESAEYRMQVFSEITRFLK